MTFVPGDMLVAREGGWVFDGDMNTTRWVRAGTPGLVVARRRVSGTNDLHTCTLLLACPCTLVNIRSHDARLWDRTVPAHHRTEKKRNT